jgi:DNA polymerase III delta prime subunit
MNSPINPQRRPCHIEVTVHQSSTLTLGQIRKQFDGWVQSSKNNNQIIFIDKNGEISLKHLPPDLQNFCAKVMVIRDDDSTNSSVCTISFSQGDTILVHPYILSTEEISTEELETDGGDGEWTSGCDNLVLPHQSLDGTWEALIFDSKIKRQLLNYAQSAILFTDKKVSSNIVQWNRILLLYGEPGTGKTSLCRALAHKLAIRLGHRFPRANLLEIHSHSLFSKWFSTSGKLVSALFQMVRDMVEDDPGSLICVLIDEVESLASSRNSTSSSGDPSDAMRAVNSLLTSLDRLRRFPNVLVLATTNLTGSIDSAFVDRVDLKIQIGLPILRARYQILQTCLEELIRVAIIKQPCSIFDFDDIDEDGEHKMDCHRTSDTVGTGDDITSRMLLDCARQAEGFSGRSLRKLPLQAYAQYLGCNGCITTRENGVPPHIFLEALSLAIMDEQKARAGL